MRRLLWAVILAASACSGDVPAGDPGVAAVADGQRLTSAELGAFLRTAQPDALSERLAGFVARVWVDYTLLAQAIVRGEALTDSAALARALEVPVDLATLGLWHDTLLARRPPPDPSLAEAVFHQDSVRVLQHIQLSLRPDMSEREVHQVRQRVDQLLAAARGGADFAALARRESSDTSSAREGGFLPPRARGAWVQPLDSVGWSLAPGQVGVPLLSPFGAHLVRRPTLDEVRGRLLDWVRTSRAYHDDSLHADSLLRARAAVVARFAADTLRAIVAWSSPSTGSPTALVTLREGAFTRRDAEQALATLPPETLESLARSADASLLVLARELAAARLLRQEARAAGVQVSTAQRQRLAQFYLREWAQLLDVAGFGAAALTDPARAPGERADLAARLTLDAVARYVTGRARYRPMQPGLALRLRSRPGFALSPAGIRRAVAIARDAQAKAVADSAARGQKHP
jgi:hypothetical protein